MLKTIKNLFVQDKERLDIPKNVQDVIPSKTIYDDGVFLSGKNKYSKSFKFTDINYAVASKSDKEAIFLQYSELLNSLDTGATSKLTIINRRMNRNEFEKNIMIPLNNDDLDKYRKEYNKMLMEKVLSSNSIVQEKYITISINKKTIEEARIYFKRITADLSSHFNQLGSRLTELDVVSRLRIAHDFYRTGEENIFNFDMLNDMRRGHSFKDYICPDSFSFQKDYFEMGNKYGRVFFLKNYASYIKDTMISEFTELNRNLMLSIDIIPIPMDEAIREVENRRLGVETNITNWQRRQNNNNNFSAVIPYDMEQQRNESKDFLDDLTIRDQRMFVSVLTMVLIGNTKVYCQLVENTYVN